MFLLIWMFSRVKTDANATAYGKNNASNNNSKNNSSSNCYTYDNPSR